MEIDAHVQQVARLADDGGITLAVAESLTCGALVSALGRGENSAKWLSGAVVAYQVSTKVDVLGVDPSVDPCSADCAVQMAVGVRERLGADLAVATMGVGGPEPEDGHAPGTVYIGWASDQDRGHRGFRFEGGPVEVLEQSVEAALVVLRGRLERD